MRPTNRRTQISVQINIDGDRAVALTGIGDAPLFGDIFEVASPIVLVEAVWLVPVRQVDVQVAIGIVIYVSVDGGGRRVSELADERSLKVGWFTSDGSTFSPIATGWIP